MIRFQWSGSRKIRLGPWEHPPSDNQIISAMGVKSSLVDSRPKIRAMGAELPIFPFGNSIGYVPHQAADFPNKQSHGIFEFRPD